MLRQAMDQTDNFPIKTKKPVHNGKVRSAYWLTDEDSSRLISKNNYDVAPTAELGIMIISDRISAFDCLWKTDSGMKGIPGKGAALNAISHYWFSKFKQHGFADHHILDTPHPLVWIVQKAKPIKIEAIARQYITGSMWRNYAKGEKNICGIQLPDNLSKNQRLENLLITPSTKGVIFDIEGLTGAEDENISRKIIEDNYARFNFKNIEDINTYEKLLVQGFDFIQKQLADIGQIFVDTKFEFGYVEDSNGQKKMIYIDEIGTPDSSRMWDAEAFKQGKIIEKSKEFFREKLLEIVSDTDTLLDPKKMHKRIILASNTFIPEAVFLEVSEQYQDFAKQITNQSITISDNPRQEILDVLGDLSPNLLF